MVKVIDTKHTANCQNCWCKVEFEIEDVITIRRRQIGCTMNHYLPDSYHEYEYIRVEKLVKCPKCGCAILVDSKEE